ncbi:hypothetical protein SEA_MAGRITTE_131 [Microbacterium phage Magritte]|nr:hypothetical protein SEA_MAGRITTE_131 [Microbacterium phage Magritte]
MSALTFEPAEIIRHNRSQAWLAILGLEFRVARAHFRRVRAIHRAEQDSEPAR